MVTQFRDGALVRLKSGGPLMTVSVDPAIGPGAGAARVMCSWFDGDNRMQTASVPISCLKAG